MALLTLNVRLCSALGLLWLLPFPPWSFVIALLVPVFVSRTESATEAGIAFAGYVASATLSFLAGIAVYFDSWPSAIAVWTLIIGFNFVAGFLAGWCPRGLRVVALLILTAVPPLSLAAWPHPLATTGYLLPDFGYIGLGLAVFLLAAAAYVSNHLLLSLALLLPVIGAMQYRSPNEPPTWSGVDLMNFDPTRTEFQQHTQLQRLALLEDTQHVVFPEAVAGEWNDHACDLWRQALEGTNKSVYIGAFEGIERSTDYNNVVIRANGRECNAVHRQRLPIPIAMWHPWSDGSAAAVGLSQPASSIAWLICYEATQVWAVLDALRHQPSHLVHVANLWWAPPAVVHTQRATTAGWALLFNLALVEAYQYE